MHLVEKVGARGIDLVERIGRMGLFLMRNLWCAVLPPYRIYPIVRQIYFIGARSIFVILVTGVFTGMVLGLQGYYTLTRFGSEDLLGSAVALSLIRELGPVLTALMVIGRAGSAICAEIGIMRNSEQIDSLEFMAIDPYRYLLVPKFFAGLVSIPLLTMIFDVVGLFGGYFIGAAILGVNEGAYFFGAYDSVVWHDVAMGLVKSFIFALLIIWVATAKGFFIHLESGGAFGPEGVSRVTTDAVVLASVLVLVWDYLISAIML